MAQPGTITMSMRELDRLTVIQAVIEERLMPWRAAERLGLSRRQVERLANRYRCEVRQDWFHVDEAGRAIISCRSICARRLWR